MRLNRPHSFPSSHRETISDRPDTTPTTGPRGRGCDATPSPDPITCVRRRRSRRRGLAVTGLASLAVLSTASSAHADTMVLAIAGSVDEVLTNIRNWLMGILALLATVFLTIGGVRRVFGGGDPGEQEKSKEAFKAAGIGYALAALAPLVVTVLKGIVGG
ncbi:hypothetical protein LV79_003784 [Actinokineospora globicatena]|nr:hypothetical protein [Actinokineospora globicatena]